MTKREVDCGTHGMNAPAFLCRHLIDQENVGWNEPEHYDSGGDDPFSGCINAWCDKCEKFALESGGWNDESEAFADVQMICEECALRIKSKY